MRSLRTVAMRCGVGSTAVLLCVAGMVGAGSPAKASVTAHLQGATQRSAAPAAASTCDPDDLPGGAEGPDNDGDECNFTITGSIKLPPVSTDPNSEFAVGSKALAAQCNKGYFSFAETVGHGVLAGFSAGRTPTAASWLTNFLAGTGKPQGMPDGSLLSNEAKTDPQFLAADKSIQAAAKALLDTGQQGVDVSSSLKTVDFSSFRSNPDLRGAFGGTQRLDVSGTGYLENGRYVGTITYIIRDVYGFYAKSKFLGAGPLMHYLQGVCGAPFTPGGAHWFYDSVTVTVPLTRPGNVGRQCATTRWDSSFVPACEVGSLATVRQATVISRFRTRELRVASAC